MSSKNVTSVLQSKTNGIIYKVLSLNPWSCSGYHSVTHLVGFFAPSAVEKTSSSSNDLGPLFWLAIVAEIMGISQDLGSNLRGRHIHLGTGRYDFERRRGQWAQGDKLWTPKSTRKIQKSNENVLPKSFNTNIGKLKLVIICL